MIITRILLSKGKKVVLKNILHHIKTVFYLFLLPLEIQTMKNTNFPFTISSFTWIRQQTDLENTLKDMKAKEKNKRAHKY